MPPFHCLLNVVFPVKYIKHESTGFYYTTTFFSPRFYNIVFDIYVSPCNSSYIILPLIEWGLYCNHLVHPSVHTFVTDISASTGRNDFIFDIWLWHGDCTVSPLSRFTAHLLPVYSAT